MDFPSAPSFRQAGYAPLVTNSSYNGGLVRQHGNVSFSRVFEAGHAVAADQPETMYQVFQRSMFGMDVATGKQRVGGNYSTAGPLSSWATKDDVPRQSPENVCYTYLATETCLPEQLEALNNGTAVIKDFVVIEPAGKSLIATSGHGISTNSSSSGSGSGSGSGDKVPVSAASSDQHGGKLSLSISSLVVVVVLLVW